MALELSLETESGIPLEKAYVRISHLAYNFEQRRAEITVQVFASQAAAANGRSALTAIGYQTYDDDFEMYFNTASGMETDPRKRAYAYLKQRAPRHGETVLDLRPATEDTPPIQETH